MIERQENINKSNPAKIQKRADLEAINSRMIRRIRSIIDERGISVRSFAEGVGISSQKAHLILNNSKNISSAFAYDISCFLNIRVDTLFQESGSVQESAGDFAAQEMIHLFMNIRNARLRRSLLQLSRKLGK